MVGQRMRWRGVDAEGRIRVRPATTFVETLARSCRKAREFGVPFGVWWDPPANSGARRLVAKVASNGRVTWRAPEIAASPTTIPTMVSTERATASSTTRATSSGGTGITLSGGDAHDVHGNRDQKRVR